MAELVAVQRPIGVFDQCITPATQVLVLKEKVFSLSRDSFDIQNLNGQSVFKIDGHHMTVSGRKTLKDAAGAPLFDIVQERLHLHATYVAEDAQGKRLMEVKNAFKVVGSEATVMITSKDGHAEELTMKGNWRDTSADIISKATGEVVARIDRSLLNKRQLFGGQQTYALIVAPGVDMALMVAACVALDEKNND